MGNNDFDSFDNSGFGDFDSSGFGDSFDDLGSDDSGFDDFVRNNPSSQNESQESFDDFDSGFETNNLSNNGTYGSNDFPDTPAQDPGSLSKKSYIMIAVGVVIVIIVIIIASAVNKSMRKKQNVAEQQTQTQTVVQQQPVQQKVNADEIMGSTQEKVESQPVQQENSNIVINNVKEGGTVWTEITSSENVVFNENTTEMTFTVTGITHKARAVDASETLVVKTTLTGSISGLPGTYELDIPYDKGVKIESLGIGTQFTVHVQLGSYNGRTVVGNITY